MSSLGKGFEGPLPVLSMNFLRSVVQYSKTCIDQFSTSSSDPFKREKIRTAIIQIQGASVPTYQIEDRLIVLFYVFHAKQSA